MEELYQARHKRSVISTEGHTCWAGLTSLCYREEIESGVGVVKTCEKEFVITDEITAVTTEMDLAAGITDFSN